MLKKIFKLGTMAAVLISCLMVLNLEVFAAGSVSISADVESSAVGETIHVSYQAENPEGASEAPQISVTYDPNRLTFVECDKEYGGGGGGLITLSDTEANIAFTVISGGTATVSVEAILDGDGADVPTASVDVYAEGEDTASQVTETADSGTGVEEGSIMYSDGTKVISTVFANEYMPALFHKSTTQYEGQDVEVAVFDMDESIKLLYVTDTAGQNGSFNIYDPAANTLADFRMIQGIENRFIIILPTPDDLTPPDGFTRVTLQWNNQTIGAYMFTEESDDEDDDEGESVVDNSGVSSDKFFLLYSISSEGNKGWYMYDQEEGTYLRYPQFIAGSGKSESEGFFASLTGSEDGDDDEEGFFTVGNIKLIIIIALAVILIVMIVVMINMGLKLRDYQSYDYIDEEEEDDEDEGESEGHKKSASSLAASQMEDDIEISNIGDDEDDDDDDDDDDDRSAKKRLKAEKKEKKKQEKLEKKKKKRGYAEPEAMDWSSFEKNIKEEDDDDRRPMGNDVEKLPPQYRDAALQNSANSQSDMPANASKKQPATSQAAPNPAEDDDVQVKAPSMKRQQQAAQGNGQNPQGMGQNPQAQARYQQEMQQKSREQAKIEQAQYEQIQREQAMREQAMKEQIIKEQARREQLQREQAMREQYEREQYYNNNNPYAPNAYNNGGMGNNQYSQPQNVDLDEDFEFEFLNIGD